MKVGSRAMYLVDEIIKRDLLHRKGTRPSEWVLAEVAKHLRNELDELFDEICVIAAFEAVNNKREIKIAREGARYEVADIYCVALHLARRLDMSFEDLEAKAIEKMQLRFENADQVVIPEAEGDAPAGDAITTPRGTP